MRVLLDTCSFWYWAVEPHKVSAGAREILEDRTNEIFFSAVSSWELAILLSNRRLNLSGSLSDFVDDQLSAYDFQRLLIRFDHTILVRDLPFIHKDPFDRLLIAQAQIEKLVILTDDEMIPKYEVQALW